MRAVVNSMDFLRLLSSLFTEFKEAPSEPSATPGDSLQNRVLCSEEIAVQQILILFDLEFYFVLYNHFFFLFTLVISHVLIFKIHQKNHY